MDDKIYENEEEYLKDQALKAVDSGLIKIPTVDEIVSEVLPQIPIPKDGEKGDKGDRGERGLPGIDGQDGKDGRDGRDGKDGLDGKDGKDGESPNIKKVLKKELKDLKIKSDQIIGLEKLLPKYPPEYAGGSGATFLKSMRDVDLSGLTNNSILKYSAEKQKWAIGTDSEFTSLPIGASITGGTANRVLFENSSNELAESNNLTFDGTNLSIVAPTSDLHAATKKYVDDEVGGIDLSGYVPYTGATTDVDLGANDLILGADIEMTGGGVINWNDSYVGNSTLGGSSGWYLPSSLGIGDTPSSTYALEINSAYSGVSGGALYATDSYYYAWLADGTSAGYFDDGINNVRISDGNYAINAAGDFKLNGYIFDDSDIDSIGPTNRQLYDAGASNVIIDWSGTENSGAALSFDSIIGEAVFTYPIFVPNIGSGSAGSRTVSIDPNNRSLHDIFGNAVVTWGDGTYAISADGDVYVNGSIELPSIRFGAILSYLPSGIGDSSLSTDGTGNLGLPSTKQIYWDGGDVTITHAANTLKFAGASSGYWFKDGLIRPEVNDGVALGDGNYKFSDLFLASGGTINFNKSDVIITHSSNLLTLSGGNLTVPTLNATGARINTSLNLEDFSVTDYIHMGRRTYSTGSGCGLWMGQTSALSTNNSTLLNLSTNDLYLQVPSINNGLSIRGGGISRVQIGRFNTWLFNALYLQVPEGNSGIYIGLVNSTNPVLAYFATPSYDSSTSNSFEGCGAADNGAGAITGPDSTVWTHVRMIKIRDHYSDEELWIPAYAPPSSESSSS